MCLQKRKNILVPIFLGSSCKLFTEMEWSSVLIEQYFYSLSSKYFISRRENWRSEKMIWSSCLAPGLGRDSSVCLQPWLRAAAQWLSSQASICSLALLQPGGTGAGCGTGRASNTRHSSQPARCTKQEVRETLPTCCCLEQALFPGPILLLSKNVSWYGTKISGLLELANAVGASLSFPVLSVGGTALPCAAPDLQCPGIYALIGHASEMSPLLMHLFEYLFYTGAVLIHDGVNNLFIVFLMLDLSFWMVRVVER